MLRRTRPPTFWKMMNHLINNDAAAYVRPDLSVIVSKRTSGVGNGP
jgi:hypothetical protein